jgi:hypothetical protein
MTITRFKDSLKHDVPPNDIRYELRALWLDARGEWEKAHSVVQNIDTPESAWVHAYLHRRQGDSKNAAYWYERAGRKVCTTSLEDEWQYIAENLLE